MDCKTIKRNIIFIVDGSLPAVDINAAKVHIEQCPACSLLHKNMSHAMAMHPALLTHDNDDTFFDEISTKIINRQSDNSNKKPAGILRDLLQPLLVAASVSVVIFLGVHLLGQAKQQQPVASDTMNTQINELASQYQMKDDGTDAVDTYYLNK